MKLISWIMLLALAQLCCLLGDDYSDHSLMGLNTVKVAVETLPPGAAKLGLTEEAIQTDVELKLRLAGMRVVNTVAFDTEVLYVNVNATSDGRAVSIAVELQQGARLLRDPNIMIFTAVTWSTGSVTIYPTAQFIRDSIKEKVDIFLNAWLSVNPKK
jgi:hypothetical protein